MLENGRRRNSVADADPLELEPVVKLFTPDTTCVWLLTEIDPEEPDLLFGLCDLGMGYPALGYVRLTELEAVRGPRGRRVKCDSDFTPDKPLGKYAEEARISGRALGSVLS
jgi:hypothetical protein